MLAPEVGVESRPHASHAPVVTTAKGAAEQLIQKIRIGVGRASCVHLNLSFFDELCGERKSLH